MKYNIQFKANDTGLAKYKVLIHLKDLTMEEGPYGIENISAKDIVDDEDIWNSFPYEDMESYVQAHIELITLEFLSDEQPEKVKSKTRSWITANFGRIVNTKFIGLGKIDFKMNPITRPAEARIQIYTPEPFKIYNSDEQYIRRTFPYENVRIRVIKNQIRIITEVLDKPAVARKKLDEWSEIFKKYLERELGLYQFHFSTSIEDASEPRSNILGPDSYVYYYDPEKWEERYDHIRDIILQFIKKHYDFVNENDDSMVLPNQGTPSISIRYRDNGYLHKIGLIWDSKDKDLVKAYKISYRLHPMSGVHEPFTTNELRMLDELDVELLPDFEKETGQHITDWFGR